MITIARILRQHPHLTLWPAASLVVVLDSEPRVSMRGGISSPDGELENQSGPGRSELAGLSPDVRRDGSW